MTTPNDMQAPADPQPIVTNDKAPGDLKVGDYVYASRWSDCDPGDPWSVGFVTEVGRYDSKVYPGFVLVGDSPRRWVHARRITEEQGRRICAEYPGMESLPQDYDAIARVWGISARGIVTATADETRSGSVPTGIEPGGEATRPQE